MALCVWHDDSSPKPMLVICSNVSFDFMGRSLISTRLPLGEEIYYSIQRTLHVAVEQILQRIKVDANVNITKALPSLDTILSVPHETDTDRTLASRFL